MGKGKSLSIETRSAVIVLNNEGYSERDIARKLGISPKGVHYTLVRYRKTGSLSDRKRSGRPKVTSAAEDRFIVTTSKRNRRLTAPDITRELNKTRNKKVSISTVKNRLSAAGLHGCLAVKKPLLRAIHKKKRLQWAKQHEHWTMEQWKTVLWTDESKFQIFGSNRRVFVRRRSHERVSEDCLVSSVKHGGGNVLVWGCFAGTVVGDLVKIDGIMRKEQYLQILKNHALPSGLRIIGEPFIFQQDNDPKHTARVCKTFLEEQESRSLLELMVWPPQSPDLSPIEKLWDELDRKAKERLPRSTRELWQYLQEAWKEISAEYLNKLLERMPRICQAVIKAKGGHIDENQL